MSANQFHLLGEHVSTAQDIDISDLTDLEDVQHLVASYFAIVDSRGKEKKMPGQGLPTYKLHLFYDS